MGPAIKEWFSLFLKGKIFCDGDALCCPLLVSGNTGFGAFLGVIPLLSFSLPVWQNLVSFSKEAT